MKAIVYSKNGHKKKEIVLNPEIYAARVNKRLLELVRNAYAANLRHGTASTKTRKEVRGGGKKPWKQKGTGRARHGSIRSPIWKGGGTVFGPHPRSYYVALPTTMRKQALISALSLRGQSKSVVVLEDVKLDQPKTREWSQVVKRLPLDGKRSLCVVKAFDENLKRASRNLTHRVHVCEARDVNARDVLQREKLIIEQDALPVLEARLLGHSKKVPAEKSAQDAES
ncbi:MAG: 50S ribosomal protein L4 [Omnitrophica bacterium GWA2_52_8]|nr:MAG: 50S ribosomal protein L4 [Omnitrophica bacterium GWA2_52_8]